ncbi:MAG: 4-hydroxy-tetrahydrodipicolinate reductase [Planctomycetota bacterium]|jgi:4-hydroxy-tetrahydrodipicolinate reductase
MRIAVNGAAGAMGRRVIALAHEAEGCQVVAALERTGHPELGRDAGEVAGVGPLGVAISTGLSHTADVLIDFSAPEAALSRAEECAGQGIAMLIGTTGLSHEQLSAIEQTVARRVPVLVASNMSLGINLLFGLAAQVATALPEDYDVEIVEAHHRRKVDAPSGTAMELARRIARARGVDEEVGFCYGRHGRTGPRGPGEIAVHAVRGGDIVGEHTIIFAAEGERIELTHRASSRDVFARGALRAAAFLTGQEAGMFSMSDVLR